MNLPERVGVLREKGVCGGVRGTDGGAREARSGEQWFVKVVWCARLNRSTDYG